MSSQDDGGVAPLQPLTFELYVILLRRFKLEIVLSGTEEEMVVVVDPADKSQQTAAAAAEEKPRSARCVAESFAARRCIGMSSQLGLKTARIMLRYLFVAGPPPTAASRA